MIKAIVAGETSPFDYGVFESSKCRNANIQGIVLSLARAGICFTYICHSALLVTKYIVSEICYPVKFVPRETFSE